MLPREFKNVVPAIAALDGLEDLSNGSEVTCNFLVGKRGGSAILRDLVRKHIPKKYTRDKVGITSTTA